MILENYNESLLKVFRCRLTRHSSSVGSVPASYASGLELDPLVKLILSRKFFLQLIQEEQVVSYWQKNWHSILVNCHWEAHPGTVWLLLLTVLSWPQLFTMDVKKQIKQNKICKLRVIVLHLINFSFILKSVSGLTIIFIVSLTYCLFHNT